MEPLLAALAADPSPLDRSMAVAGIPFTVRGLVPGDRAALIAFLAGLSATSRRFWHRDTDPADAAADWVDAIGRTDKLRLVAHPANDPADLAGVVDLSFALPDGYEITRYARYGITLDPARTARFGPCVADDWRGLGLAPALLPPAWDAVRLLGRDTVVLFGGVRTANQRAVRFYLRAGFAAVGTFTDEAGDGVDMMLELPPGGLR
ncbi:GNAT family N-acetyltransferase [Actinoplanes sp. NPDC023714]|uniref:GNAT family N-acetyltransferase n=1 Tax=Actinoplanes sp. NPDC023714 TaxID=3154322 RepID=UPI0033CE8461